MPRTAEQLRSDALQIWWAGVQAVQPPSLIFNNVRVAEGALWIGDERLELDAIDRIVIVGGGKASGGMATTLEQALGPELLQTKRVIGWVNVPADCVVPTDRVTLHPARPAGVNEPTEAGVSGVQEMLRLVGDMGPRDLCVALISGGGSALMPAPVEGLSLADKVEITRELSARGAAIDLMNAVRRDLSTFKGGGLARACRAGRMISLILSDVPGDDLHAVASGPTVSALSDKARAIEILKQFSLDQLPAGRRAIDLLSLRRDLPPDENHAEIGRRVTNLIVGNNAAAVDASGVEAERLGYSHAMLSATAPEGPVEEVARRLAETANRMRRQDSPDCLITGGEPTVSLAPADVRGSGGRNQQLALAALAAIDDWRGLALVSGGTDGEDGPTDAAGALVDEQVASDARRLLLDMPVHLARNDAYSFFQAAGGLLKTGPTQTNVCDLRVVTVSR